MGTFSKLDTCTGKEDMVTWLHVLDRTRDLTKSCNLLFQIIRCFGFLDTLLLLYIYLDIVYIYIHRKYYIAREAKISYNLEWRE
jgi:hypothetical protein